jgi:membrane fusion protein, multidrug efflux system
MATNVDSGRAGTGSARQAAPGIGSGAAAAPAAARRGATETAATQARAPVHRKPVAVGATILLVLVAAAAAGLVWWWIWAHYASTDDAAVDGPHVSVSSRTTGRIAVLAVDEGDSVKEGDLLIRLDDADLRAQQVQIAASINQASLNLNLARVNLERVRNDFARAKALYGSGNSSAEQYDHAIKAQEAAETQYAIAEAQVETARAQMGVVEAQLAATRITAPIGGVVARRSYAAGEVVQPGQAIFLINDLRDVWVVANYEETVIRMIRPGQRARIRVDAYPDLRFEGTVEQVGAAIKPPPFSIGESTKTTQRIPVRVSLDGVPAPAALVPGLSVEVTIKVK